MENSKKTLKIYGILFIILAIWDVVNFALNYFLGDLKEMWNLNLEGIPENVIQGVVIILFVIMGIVALIKLFLGIRGIQQSNGTYKGKSHLTIAKIIMGIVIISVILSIPGLKWETSTLIKFLDDIVTLIILFDYIRNGKKLMNE